MTKTSTRSRFGRSAFAILAGAGMVLSLAACSGGSAAGSTDDELLGKDAYQAWEDWNYDFEACMKDEGLDISEGIPMDMSGSTPTASSEYEKLQTKCFDKVGQPPALPEMPTDEEMKEQMLTFAKCMRGLGYDYPDPDFSDGLPMVEAMDSETVNPDDIDQCSLEAYPELASMNAEGAGGAE